MLNGSSPAAPTHTQISVMHQPRLSHAHRQGETRLHRTGCAIATEREREGERERGRPLQRMHCRALLWLCGVITSLCLCVCLAVSVCCPPIVDCLSVCWWVLWGCVMLLVSSMQVGATWSDGLNEWLARCSAISARSCRSSADVCSVCVHACVFTERGPRKPHKS